MFTGTNKEKLMTTFDRTHLVRKLCTAILAFLLVFALLGSGTVYGISLVGQEIPGITDIAGEGTPPEITAQSAILIDANTGQILYEKDAYTERYPASTTKVMTALLAIEKLDMDKIITCDSEVASQSGSQIYLQEGEEVRVEDLLYAMMLSSANDAAAALGIAVGGSTEHFVEMMNEKAVQAGAKNTHFNNSNGLPDEAHTTTAYDLAVITQAAFKHAKFREVVATINYNMPATNMNEARELKNSNSLLYDDQPRYTINGQMVGAKYEGATGVKPGYTDSAGSCLIGSAERDGHELIGVVLLSETEQHYPDMIQLLDYGFANYENLDLCAAEDYTYTVKVKNSETRSVPAAMSEDVSITLPKGSEHKKVAVKEKLDKSFTAPIEAGQELGTVEVSYDGQVVAAVPIVAKEAAQAKPPKQVKKVILRALKIAGIILAVLFVLFLIVGWISRTINRRRREKKRRQRRAAEARRRADASGRPVRTGNGQRRRPPQSGSGNPPRRRRPANGSGDPRRRPPQKKR